MILFNHLKTLKLGTVLSLPVSKSSMAWHILFRFQGKRLHYMENGSELSFFVFFFWSLKCFSEQCLITVEIAFQTNRTERESIAPLI